LAEAWLALMITVLMGCPAAGKTTWMHKNRTDEYLYSTEAVRINRDIEVDQFMHHIRSQAIKAVAKGLSVIADGTHTIQGHRRFWLVLSKRYNQPNRLIVFDTPLQIALMYNEMRQHPAPNHIVKQHWIRQQRAMKLIDHESWDDIQIIKRGQS
jgi:predicted kinase